MAEAGEQVTGITSQPESQSYINFKKTHPLLAINGEQVFRRVREAFNIGVNLREADDSYLNLFEPMPGKTQESRTFGIIEVQKIEQFLRELAPITVDNYQEYQHLQTSSDLAGKIVEQLRTTNPDDFSNLNSNLIRAAALLRGLKDVMDLRNTNLGDRQAFALLRWLNIRSELLQHVRQFAANDQTIEDQIIAYASLLGHRRYDDKGIPEGLVPVDDAIETQLSKLTPSLKQPQTYQEKELSKMHDKWPAQEEMTSEKIDVLRTYWQGLVKKFSELGIEGPQIQDKLLQEEKSTSVHTLVFDIGGLAQESPRAEPMLEVLSLLTGRKLDQNTAIVNDWEEIMDLFHKGLSVEAFAMAFGHRLGTTFSPEAIGFLKEIYEASIDPTMDPQMKEIIEDAKKHQYVVAAHTDTTPPHIEKNTAGGLFSSFPVVISSEKIFVKKNDPRAFQVLVTILGLTGKSHTIIFIDDNKNNVENAETAGVQAIKFNPSDPNKFNDLRKNFARKGVLLS